MVHGFFLASRREGWPEEIARNAGAINVATSNLPSFALANS